MRKYLVTGDWGQSIPAHIMRESISPKGPENALISAHNNIGNKLGMEPAYSHVNIFLQKKIKKKIR